MPLLYIIFEIDLQHVMAIARILTTVLFLLTLASAYDQHDDYEYIMHYYQQNSQFPIVHAYYNHHFSKSKQFQDFLNVVEQTQYRNKDFAKFLLTDCQKLQERVSEVCDDMKRSKDNHAIVGYYPSGQFINYAGKKMQNPPKTRAFRHPSDVYTIEQMQKFLYEMLPNFFQSINSMDQFEVWLQPRYSPNLLIVTRQQQIPLVVAQLGIYFFLRYDMGYLHDLTESVVKHLNITTFPALIVLKYNFESEINQLYRYPGKQLSTANYDDIKQYLQILALKKPRNDILYHKMKAHQNYDIATTDTIHELAEMLDMSSGWVMVQQTSGKPEQLPILKQKYGRFFEYIHFVNNSQPEHLVKLYDPERKRTFDLPKGDIQWRALAKDEFISNTTVFLSKGFAVIGVRQKYSHFCTLALNNFFRGLTHCFIVREEDYEQASQQINMQFDIGFVCYQKIEKGQKKVSGNNFKSAQFQDVYMTAQYQTRLKSKLVIDDFFQRPIKQIEGTDKLSQLCAFPFKKCGLLFTDSQKFDRTAYEYLKDVAKNFINEYQFYEVDIKCNQHFKEQIQHLKKSTNGLVVYHPRQDSYVYLKAKLSRGTFQRFLKANMADDKKLPYRKWNVENIQVHSCRTKKPAKSQEADHKSQQKSQLMGQL